MTTITEPTTELDMYNLANEFNAMRASKRKAAISAIFDGMTCQHGCILVGEKMYEYNGDKCIRTSSLDYCFYCARDIMAAHEADQLAKQVQDAPEIEVCPLSAQGATPDEMTPLEEEASVVWDKLLQTPSYVERDLHDVPMFVEASDAYIEVENSIREGDFVILIPMEDEPTHTDARPFCSDPECACHYDDALFDEYIFWPMMEGLLTSYEANAIRWGEQI